MHRAAEVAEHDVAVDDHAIRSGRGAGSPRSARWRRWRSWRARDRRRACARPARGARRARVRPAKGASRMASRDVVDRPCAAARSASISAASFTMRSGPVTSVARRNATSGRARCRSSTKRAHVWSPIAADVAARPTDEAGDDRRSDRRSRPRRALERVGLLDDPRRLERGHHEHRVAVGREHEHGQPLERHRLVAGEVRQVGAGGEQQHVDAELPHPRRAHARSAPRTSSRPHGSASATVLEATADAERRGQRWRRAWRGSWSGRAGPTRRGAKPRLSA